MQRKQMWKIIIDILMTVLLLLLMAYSMVGEKAHEWLGIGMFALFILHHVMNHAWSRNLLKGKYTPFRILQTVLVVLVLASMLGSMVSGIILSRYALSFLPINGGQSWARTAHMLSAYWGFVFISLHLGLHWNIMIGMVKRLFHKPSPIRSWFARAVPLIFFLFDYIAVMGLFVFIGYCLSGKWFLRKLFTYGNSSTNNLYKFVRK